MVTPLLAGVRAVVFDAVGTLIHPDPSAAVVYADVGRRFGSRRTPEEIAPRFAAAFAREEVYDEALGLRTSEARELQRWQRIVALVLDDVTDGPACFEALFEHFRRPSAWTCDPEVAAVAALAGQGYALGIASNYDARLRSVAAGLPALAPLRHLIISSDVGWRKPAPEFFAAVRRCLGLPAEQILFLGDDLDNDYAGARQAGLRAVLFDPKGHHAGSGLTRISRLKDLLSSEAAPWR